MLTITEAIFSGSLIIVFLILGALSGAFIYFITFSYPKEQIRIRPVNVLLICSAAPLLVILLLSFLILLPSFANWLGLVSEHCHQSINGVSRFCGPHRPVPLHNVFGWWISVLLTGIFLRFLFVLSDDIDRINDILRTLEISTKARITGDVGVIDSEHPLALSVGFPQARIFISSHLTNHLSETELAVVLAHERAHIRRRDILKYLLVRTLCYLHFPAVRRGLLGDLSLAIENACDEVAAAEIGDRHHVAETILSVERLFRSCSPRHCNGAFSIAGSNIAARIELLLGERQSTNCHWWLPTLGSSVVGLLIFASVNPLHYFVEMAFAR